MASHRKSQPQQPDSREQLTVAEVCAELKVARSTFYAWRQTGKGPAASKLPNGDIRILRSDLDTWLRNCREDVA
jgi:excisionase family DNA binding protein